MQRKLLTAVIVSYLSFATQSSFAQMSDVVVLQNDSANPIRLLRRDNDEVNIKIDGRLDEPVWQHLLPVGVFVVVKPDTLATTPYATNFRIFYTEKGLYASFDVDQPPVKDDNLHNAL